MFVCILLQNVRRQLVRPLVSQVRHQSQFQSLVPRPSKFLAKQILLQAKYDSKLTYQQLADKLNVNKVWLVSAMCGEHPIDKSLSEQLVKLLNIKIKDDELKYLVEAMTQMPESRGKYYNKLRDPVISRLEEIVSVYGESIKELIRDEAGDGIMSAIDCKLTFDTEVNKDNETRFILKIDGKYLPYKH